MITWATFPFVRYTPALILGIVGYLYLGAAWPELWPYAATWQWRGWAGHSVGRPPAHPGRCYDVGRRAGSLLAIVACWGPRSPSAPPKAAAPTTSTASVTTIESYQAVVDDYTVVRAATLRHHAAGAGRARGRALAPGHGRRAGVAAPGGGHRRSRTTARCGWCAATPTPASPRSTPASSTTAATWSTGRCTTSNTFTPTSTGCCGLAPPNVLVAISMRAAAQLDGVFPALHQGQAGVCHCLGAGAGHQGRRGRWPPSRPTPTPAPRTSWP